MASKVLTQHQSNQLEIVKDTIAANINNSNQEEILAVACENFKYAFAQAITIAGLHC